MNFDLHLTTDCNMRCNFCGAWEYGKEKRYISLKNAKNALSEARLKGYRITTLTGGEPTLHPEFCEVLKDAFLLGYWTVVTTNGLNISEKMLKTFKSCNTLVRVSLHSMDCTLHREITGGDTLSIILANIQLLKQNQIKFAIGCTVFDRNINQIQDIAKFAWESKAQYIRYTPVVGIRGANEIKLSPTFFYELLETIFKICICNKEILDYQSHNTIFRDNFLDFMLTRQCAGGSKQHIIYDCSGRVLPCSFIPEEMGFCSESKGTVSERIEEIYVKVNNFQNYKLKGKLMGKCSKCNYSDTCLGGCLTTKIGNNLPYNAEQPICIKEIVNRILSKFNEEDRNMLIDYWCINFRRKYFAAEATRYCMRHLPIWEISFRRGIERNQYEFNKMEKA